MSDPPSRYEPAAAPVKAPVYLWCACPGYVVLLLPPRPGSAPRSSLRELMSSLREHLAQVPLDGARADEQLGADLGVRAGRRAASRAICASWAVSSSRGLDGALADGLAGGQQLAAGALGERLGAHRG